MAGGRPRGVGRPPDLAERKSVERLLAELPNAGTVPRKQGELAFDAPWQVRALGMAVELHGKGQFPWADFQERLVGAIQEWEEADPGDRGDWSYYRYWVAALERLVEEQGLLDATELEQRTEEYLTGTRDPRHR